MSKTFDVSKSTYERLERQILEKGHVVDLKKMGAPEKITYADKKKIKYLLSKERKISMKEIHAKIGKDKFSYMTLTRYLKQNNYYTGNCICKPLLRSFHLI